MHQKRKGCENHILRSINCLTLIGKIKDRDHVATELNGFHR